MSLTKSIFETVAMIIFVSFVILTITHTGYGTATCTEKCNACFENNNLTKCDCRQNCKYASLVDVGMFQFYPPHLVLLAISWILLLSSWGIKDEKT